MPRKTNSLKNALSASLQAETGAFQDRLARADAQMNGDRTPPQDAPESGEVPGAAETAAVARVVRETFTIPEAEHGQIEEIRQNLLHLAVAASKSEVVRAGLLLLAELDSDAQKAAFDRLERVKTGRPKTV